MKRAFLVYCAEHDISESDFESIEFEFRGTEANPLSTIDSKNGAYYISGRYDITCKCDWLKIFGGLDRTWKFRTGFSHSHVCFFCYLNYHANRKRIIVEIIRYCHVEESELDEMWSFAQKKKNQRRLWLAIDHNTRKIIAFAFGRRIQAVFMKLLKPFDIRRYGRTGLLL